MKPLHIVLLLLTVTLVACDSSGVRSYEAPKDEGPPAAAVIAEPSGAARDVPSWTVPDGWEELPGEGMRFATLHPIPGDDSIEVRVTPLGKIAKDPLSNANRWASQVGLEPMDAAGLAKISRLVRAGEREAFLVDLKGPSVDGAPGERILGAILDGDEHTWFFMLPGPTDEVEPHVAAFEAFVASVRLAPGDAGLPAGHPEVAAGTGGPIRDGDGAAGSPAGDEAVTHALPAGWEVVPSDAQFRLLTVRAGEAVVAVTKFPGSVGGMLMNVNRWRGQVGLPAIADISEQPLGHVHVAGGEAQFIDLSGPGGQSMLVYTVPRGSMTWFFKLSGTAGQVEAQRVAYQEFMNSVGFQG